MYTGDTNDPLGMIRNLIKCVVAVGCKGDSHVTKLNVNPNQVVTVSR